MVHYQDVTVVYPDGTRALSGVDLHFERGEFAFITGASGSGKSTLLQLTFREIEPTSGRVIVDGQDVSQLSGYRIPLLRRKVGVVFQDFRLLPARTVSPANRLTPSRCDWLSRPLREPPPAFL